MTAKQQKERKKSGDMKTNGSRKNLGSRQESPTLRQHALKTTSHQREPRGELMVNGAQTSQVSILTMRQKAKRGPEFTLVQDETHLDCQSCT